MIDEYSGLGIRKTLNGMRAEDGLPTPPQTKQVLKTDKNGVPVDLKSLIGDAPRKKE